MSYETSTLYYAANGRTCGEGFRPFSVSDEVVRIAMYKAEDTNEAIVLEDGGEYTVYIPNGEAETFDTWDQAIAWSAKVWPHSDLI